MNVNLFDDTVVPAVPLRSRAVTKDVYPDEETAPFPSETPIAMAYVPYQQWNEVYGEEEAMCSGTLFPDLVRPFRGGGSQ